MSERIEKLLAVMLLYQMKTATMKEKVVQLNVAGFTNLEIADLLDTTTGNVAQLLYENKKTGKKKTRKNTKNSK